MTSNPPNRSNELRLAAILSAVGIVLLVTGSRFHGGAQPQDLQAVSADYAANPHWHLVHLLQFLGLFAMLAGQMSLLSLIRERSDSSFAWVATFAAVVAACTYAANQAVDGAAIQYVSQAFVAVPEPERATALRIAEAVRHVEQGLSGLAVFSWGLALLLAGAAILLSRVFPCGRTAARSSAACKRHFDLLRRFRTPQAWSLGEPTLPRVDGGGCDSHVARSPCSKPRRAPLTQIRRELAMRKSICIGVGLVVALVVAAAIELRPDLAIRVATSLVSHEICSGVFVSGLKSVATALACRTGRTVPIEGMQASMSPARQLLAHLRKERR